MRTLIAPPLLVKGIFLGRCPSRRPDGGFRPGGHGVCSAGVGPLAFVGGTGAEGFGLALRFAAAGTDILIGSRVPERAEAAAARIRATVQGAGVRACANAEAVAGADRVFLTIPYAGLGTFIDSVDGGLAGKLVVDVIVPVGMRAGFFELVAVRGAASVGELIQERLPAARVVSAFKNVSAETLGDPAASLDGDVVLCGNDPDARAEVASLVRLLPGLRPVDAGGMGNARYLEAITALLLNLNRRYRARTSIAIRGV
jgi:NADPH-dependent F420 reductase